MQNKYRSRLVSTHRTHLKSRAAVISNSGLHFLGLTAEYLMSGSNEEEIIILPSHTVCFVFPRQGQQWTRIRAFLCFISQRYPDMVHSRQLKHY